ncbi:FTFMHR domain-containing protein [Aspergillus tanneri]|uniref:C2H2-type domain-containing protein n=1 Tax=Aspergillus tanneri TaxID=1220188 RepID=A0A5M9MNF6_9EURO|nr:uncharacterized protein ATNIH1004_004440 [Aspergillus tanneri]KAA8648555.1 hypothetical protein ATNIH1004_004440 [Aspergillus tanneri]
MVMKRCTICDRRFKKTEHFKRHERSHTKEKPYECNVCHKRFSRSDVLSRHAKGHNGATASAPPGAKDGQPVTTVDPASIRRPSALSNDNPPYLNGTRATELTQQTPVIPHDMPSSTTGLPPTSLDFLATVSARHARPEPEVSSMTMGDQRTYFGWNEVAATDSPAYRGSLLGASPNEMTQFWFEPQADVGLHNGSPSLMADSSLGMLGEHVEASPERPDRASADSLGVKSVEGIMSERFANLQRYWLRPSNHNGRLINNLWGEVANVDLDNIFTLYPVLGVDSTSGILQESRYGLDEECRQHLLAEFGNVRLDNSHIHPVEHGAVALPNFPPAEILDMALDMYFRNFHPIVPFVHLPTFSARNSRASVLYTMCLIGMVMLGTKGTTYFVSKNFSYVLEKLTGELAKCSLGTESAENTMSIFAAVFLFLHLAAMAGEKEHLEKCQMLYISLISIAQRHGLFTATEGQILDLSFFEAILEADMKWKTNIWTFAFGLLIILPCNEGLFQANNAARWMQLIHSGMHILMPTVVAPSENVNIPDLESPVDSFGMHLLLAMVQLRLSEAYHRLLSNRASYPFAPCHTYAMDGRARCLPSLQLQIASKYADVLSQLDPNAAVMWHNMCMTLTADTQIFDLAAGRAGPGPVQKALDDIAAWSQTPAARRACLHAAHIYKAMVNRKASDQIMSHSVFSIFSAAIVLGLYVFVVPNTTEGMGQGAYLELLDDINWQAVGTEGFTSFMEPVGIQSSTPSADPAVNFIRNGGVVYLRGEPFQGGCQSARRILQDYVGLLKDAGKWSEHKFSYVLHTMSDMLLYME